MPSEDAVNEALDRIRANPSDQASWRVFYQYFRPQVAVFLYRKGFRQDLADLTQDVFHRFFEASAWSHDWSTLPARKPLMAYLLKTARNLAIDNVRRRSRRPQEDPSIELDHFPGYSPADLQPLLDRYLERLNADDRRLLELLIGGQSLTAIAVECNVTYQAAGVRVFRLRQRLKALVEDDAPMA